MEKNPYHEERTSKRTIQIQTTKGKNWFRLFKDCTRIHINRYPIEQFCRRKGAKTKYSKNKIYKYTLNKQNSNETEQKIAKNFVTFQLKNSFYLFFVAVVFFVFSLFLYYFEFFFAEQQKVYEMSANEFAICFLLPLDLVLFVGVYSVKRSRHNVWTLCINLIELSTSANMMWHILCTHSIGIYLQLASQQRFLISNFFISFLFIVNTLKSLI